MRLISFLQLNQFRHSIKLKLHGESLQNSGKTFIRNYFKHISFRFFSIKIKKKINKQMKAFSKNFHLSAIAFSQLFSFGHSVILKLTCQFRQGAKSSNDGNNHVQTHLMYPAEHVFTFVDASFYSSLSNNLDEKKTNAFIESKFSSNSKKPYEVI